MRPLDSCSHIMLPCRERGPVPSTMGKRSALVLRAFVPTGVQPSAPLCSPGPALSSVSYTDSRGSWVVPTSHICINTTDPSPCTSVLPPPWFCKRTAGCRNLCSNVQQGLLELLHHVLQSVSLVTPGLRGIHLQNTDECDLVATTGIMKKCVPIDLALNVTPRLSIRSDCECVAQRGSTCEGGTQGREER